MTWRRPIIALTVGLAAAVATTAAASPAAVAACRIPDLSIANAGKVVGMGLSGRVLRLTNVGTRSCTLARWPRFELVDEHGALPYVTRYNHGCVWFCRSQDKQVRQSGVVVVNPGRSVYLGFDQYRCDLGTQRYAVSARVVVSPTASLAAILIRIPRYPVFGYCGKGDPGSILSISPFEPTYRAAFIRM